MGLGVVCFDGLLGAKMYLKDQTGHAVYVDEVGRAYRVTPSGLLPLAAQQPPPPGPSASGAAIMPQMADLRADARELSQRDGSFVNPEKDGIYQSPAFPTSLVKYVGAGKQTRRYSTGVLPTDGDYAVGSEAIRIIRFEMPSTIFAENGAAFNLGLGNALPVGVSPLDCFLYRSQTSNQQLLDVDPRIASTVLGSGRLPGEIGDHGWQMDAGQALVIGLTPLLPNLRIDISIYVLEQRGKRNFVG